MNRRKPKGREPHDYRLFLFLRSAARCASATSVAVLLQLPAFLSSCTSIAEDKSPLGKDQQIYIQWSNIPRQAVLNCFYFDTDETQKLDCYQQFPVSEVSTVMGVSTSGPRRLVLLYDRTSREQDWYGIRSYPDLCKHRFSLLDEDPDDPQLAAETFLAASPMREAKLRLTPALTHIRLRSLAADFRRQSYADKPFVNHSLYLAYAVTECQPLSLESVRPAPLSWINCGEVDSAAVKLLPRPDMVLQEGCGVIGPDRRVISRDFYCYPGPQVQLVLSGWIGEDFCYYPVSIGPLCAGKSYELDLTLTRKGAAAPDAPLQAGTLVVDSLTEPWDWHDPLYVDL